MGADAAQVGELGARAPGRPGARVAGWPGGRVPPLAVPSGRIAAVRDPQEAIFGTVASRFDE